MTLSEERQKAVLDLLDDYIANGEKALRVELNKEIPYTDLDDNRISVIKTIKTEINKFLQKEIQLEEFKSNIDSINKRNRLWGFKGSNGQMFFNMIFNVATKHDLIDSLTKILIYCLEIPSNITEAKEKIKRFYAFVLDMNKLVISTDKREAPRIKSSLYFLSYFWQIQNNEKFPIFYNSLEITFKQLGLLSEDDDLANYYEQFFELNNKLKNIFDHKLGRSTSLWYIEHVFWYYYNRKIKITAKKTEEMIPKKEAPQIIGVTDEYLPPIVADLPSIAKNDPQIKVKYPNQELEYVLEDKTFELFRMLGYDVKKLGSGKRDADGIAKAKKEHYAIIYDCKCRQNGFHFVADDERTIIEYIQKNRKDLNNDGIERIYFAIISSNFNDVSEKQLKDILRRSGANAIVLLRADQLLEALKLKFIESSTDLDKLEFMFLNNGVVDDIQEQIGS